MSESDTTSAYFCWRSKRFASMTAGVRSATHSRITMQRMSRMKHLQVGSKEGSWPPLPNHAVTGPRRKFLDDRGAAAPLDLDAALGMEALLEAPKTRCGAIGRHEPLCVDDGNVPLAGCRTKALDRLVGFSNRRPERGRGLRVTEVVLHVDDKNGRSLAGGNAQTHTLFAVEHVGPLIVGLARSRHFNFSAMACLFADHSDAAKRRWFSANFFR